MKKLLLLFFLLHFSAIIFSQNDFHDSLMIYSTSVKININGLRIGIEKKIFKRTTLQIEGLYLGTALVKANPQIRYYPKFFKKSLAYFGLGYFYKHQENNFTDSIKVVGTDTYYLKAFNISKYIHALTLNYGFLYDDKIFKQTVHFEFNLGLGVRFKKSNRYGILANEEIDFREAFIQRPQAYQDTHGKFAIYPELNLMFSVVLPVVK